MDVIKSYDHNSQFFALRETAQFNEYGIWKYNNVHFSRHGGLKNTFIAVVKNSGNGMNTSQIREVLGIEPRSFLFHYKDIKEIRRDKIQGSYVYFNAEDRRYNEQLLKRKQLGENKKPPPKLSPTIAISILVEKIKNPGHNVEQLHNHLKNTGVTITIRAINSFFEYYGIEKKTIFLQ